MHMGLHHGKWTSGQGPMYLSDQAGRQAGIDSAEMPKKNIP
jgi:hypothetical protein